jgi:hypothetical protein
LTRDVNIILLEKHMKLKELVESAMSNAHQNLQDALMVKFALGDHDAENVLAFTLGESEWEDLSDEAREKLMSHYQKTMPYGTAKAKSGDPILFIRPALKKDLGI